ncbi:DEAD/DEAH box helicase [Trueperella bialowiezensis]|uniref:RNA helicase n=1 Tax=Trueperella bialowiezensis TaxID=312285 RepID=A0A448PBY6_9ACTO|nr:DEAD/DEAH box helicase [Trueperella bialowiezensis]VEI12468.1 Cold-shock DEAD box protein A [Trueperella bialowiezensis]
MTTFAGLNLPKNILSAITKMGYETPTPIQEQAIPPLLDGRDVVGVAQTGTGKTAAFALPMLTRVDPELEQVQALVLAPTRELAVQGADAIDEFAASTTGLRVVAVYGGAPYGPQIGKIRDGAQVVVGTPGRIMDLIDRGALQLDGVRYFVLDEADEMLRMGFAEDVEKIAADLPNERVTALFSATMPKQIRAVAQNHMNDPLEITVTPPASTIDTITQTYAVVPSRHKIGALARVLATTDADAAIVFVRTRATAEELAIELNTRGVQAATLSGDVQQRDREKLVERLRGGTLDVLVATDVAARGLDVERIGLVVNFDVPREAETYVHRIGRTGRAGREGTSLTFVTPKERSRLRRIEKITGATLTEVSLPTPAEVSGLRARRLVESAKERHAAGRLSVYREIIEEFRTEQLASDSPISPEDLIASLLALGVRDPGPSPDDEPEHLTVSFDDDRPRRDERRGKRTGGKPRTFDQDGTMYRVEVGKRDGVSPGAIVGALTNEGGLSGSQLGRIDIYPTFSLVEIDREIDSRTQKRIARARVSGRTLNISRDTGPRRSDERAVRKYRADRKFGDERRARKARFDKGRKPRHWR